MKASKTVQNKHEMDSYLWIKVKESVILEAQ